MRYFLASLMVLALVVGMANAQWVQPYPWGTDCTNWINYYDPYGPVEMIWNPTAISPFGTLGWYYICGTQAWDPPILHLELFVELETELYLNYTWAQAHRASNYEDFYYEFPGWIKSNNASRIVIHAYDGYPLDQMNHITTVVSLVNGAIPITYWYWDYAQGIWVAMEWDDLCPPGGGWFFIVPKCDQNFIIGVKADMEYHQDDGQYGTYVTLCTVPWCTL